MKKFKFSTLIIVGLVVSPSLQNALKTGTSYSGSYSSSASASQSSSYSAQISGQDINNVGELVKGGPFSGNSNGAISGSYSASKSSSASSSASGSWSVQGGTIGGGCAGPTGCGGSSTGGGAISGNLQGSQTESGNGEYVDKKYENSFDDGSYKGETNQQFDDGSYKGEANQNQNEIATGKVAIGGSYSGKGCCKGPFPGPNGSIHDSKPANSVKPPTWNQAGQVVPAKPIVPQNVPQNVPQQAPQNVPRPVVVPQNNYQPSGPINDRPVSSHQFNLGQFPGPSGSIHTSKPANSITGPIWGDDGSIVNKPVNSGSNYQGSNYQGSGFANGGFVYGQGSQNYKPQNGNTNVQYQQGQGVLVPTYSQPKPQQPQQNYEPVKVPHQPPPRPVIPQPTYKPQKPVVPQQTYQPVVVPTYSQPKPIAPASNYNPKPVVVPTYSQPKPVVPQQNPQPSYTPAKPVVVPTYSQTKPNIPVQQAIEPPTYTSPLPVAHEQVPVPVQAPAPVLVPAAVPDSPGDLLTPESVPSICKYIPPGAEPGETCKPVRQPGGVAIIGQGVQEGKPGAPNYQIGIQATPGVLNHVPQNPAGCQGAGCSDTVIGQGSIGCPGGNCGQNVPVAVGTPVQQGPIGCPGGNCGGSIPVATVVQQGSIPGSSYTPTNVQKEQGCRGNNCGNSYNNNNNVNKVPCCKGPFPGPNGSIHTSKPASAVGTYHTEGKNNGQIAVAVQKPSGSYNQVPVTVQQGGSYNGGGFATGNVQIQKQPSEYQTVPQNNYQQQQGNNYQQQGNYQQQSFGSVPYENQPGSSYNPIEGNQGQSGGFATGNVQIQKQPGGSYAPVKGQGSSQKQGSGFATGNVQIQKQPGSAYEPVPTDNGSHNNQNSGFASGSTGSVFNTGASGGFATGGQIGQPGQGHTVVHEDGSITFSNVQSGKQADGGDGIAVSSITVQKPGHNSGGFNYQSGYASSGGCKGGCSGNLAGDVRAGFGDAATAAAAGAGFAGSYAVAGGGFDPQQGNLLKHLFGSSGGFGQSGSFSHSASSSFASSSSSSGSYSRSGRFVY